MAPWFLRRKHLHMAERLCLKTHEHQTRKNGEPYATHCFGVRDILVEQGYRDYRTQIVALFHDSIEDNEGLQQDIYILQRMFGTKTFEAICTLSDNVRLNEQGIYEVLPFPDRKNHLEQILASKDPVVKRVRVADRVHNSRDLATYFFSDFIDKIVQNVEIYIPMAKDYCPGLILDLQRNMRENIGTKQEREPEYNILELLEEKLGTVPIWLIPK